MKKLLALVLALVMTMGLATVGTSAAFADAASIEHSEAVEVLNALGVVGGKENNNFDPTANVKRSEMAKMVTIAILGNVDVSAFSGAPTDLTDINGHWAEGYIKYCYSQGIIGGRGNGKFDPDANVTATEAAKMLLVAIGYNADVQGYGGDQWKVNVVRDAQLSRFYTDLSNLSVDKALTRDETAQLVYNAMDADLIEKTPTLNVTTGQISYSYVANAAHKDLLGETFEAYTFEGRLDKFSYDSTKAKWTLTVMNNTGANQTTPGTNKDAAPGATVDGATASFKIEEDVTDLFKQTVKVLYTLDSKGKLDKAVGVYPSDSTVLVSHVVGKIDVPNANAKTLRVDGKNYDLTDTASNTPIYEFEHDTDVATGNVISALATYLGGNATADKYRATYLFKLIDNTGDGKGDIIVTIPQAVAKVENLSTSSVTLKYVLSDTTYGAANKTLQRKDIDAYDGIAKGDYVIVTSDDDSPIGKWTLEKATMNSGTVTAIKGNDAQVDGAWLNQELANKTAKAGDKISYVAYNGFIAYQEGASSTGAEVFAVVVSAATEYTNKIDATYTTKLLMSDGTKKVVEVQKVNNVASNSAQLVPNRMYAYKVNSDGYYDLYDVNNTYVYSNDATAGEFITGYDKIYFGSGTTYIYADTNAGTAQVTPDTNNKSAVIKMGTEIYTIADDAVIFVYKTSSSVTVTTGAQLKKTNDTHIVTFFAADEDSSTGYDVVKLAYINGAVSSKKTYAFALDNVVASTNADGKWIAEVKVWNGSEEITLTSDAKDTQAGATGRFANVEKGVAFSYSLNSSGKVDSAVTVATTLGAGKGLAVAKYAGSVLTASDNVFYKQGTTNTITYNNGTEATYTYKIDDDTEIFYVNFGTSPVSGETSGAISVADKDVIDAVDSIAHYYANVVIMGEGDTAKLIVFDLNNDFNGIR